MDKKLPASPLTPHQGMMGICPWSPLGRPQTPFRLALRALAIVRPPPQILDSPVMKIAKVFQVTFLSHTAKVFFKRRNVLLLGGVNMARMKRTQ